MLTLDITDGRNTVTSPEGIVLYSGTDFAATRDTMLNWYASQDSDLEIIHSTGDVSLVEGYMPTALARRFQATEPGEFEIESEGEGFALVDGWIPTNKARALAAVMRPAA